MIRVDYVCIHSALQFCTSPLYTHLLSLSRLPPLSLHLVSITTSHSTPPSTPGRRTNSIHIPTESSFGLPIRRYIAETLIGNILGQPSFSLASFLVSTITDYLKIELPRKSSSSAMPMEEVCKLANDHYEAMLPAQVVQHARSLFSQHDVAWRESDKIRSALLCCVLGVIYCTVSCDAVCNAL